MKHRDKERIITLIFLFCIMMFSVYIPNLLGDTLHNLSFLGRATLFLISCGLYIGSIIGMILIILEDTHDSEAN